MSLEVEQYKNVPIQALLSSPAAHANASASRSPALALDFLAHCQLRASLGLLDDIV